MINSKKVYIIVAAFLVLTGVGALIFYFFQGKKSALPAAIDSQSNSTNISFIESAVQAPAVSGNVINSGIAGRITISDNKPFEASLEIFQSDNLKTPFISIRSHNDGTFQVPLKPGSYILKPLDPDGPIAPVHENYNFTVGSGQWLQVKIEYK